MMHHSNATNDDHGLVLPTSLLPTSVSTSVLPTASILRQRPAIPLNHLPLRPGTATLLYACGYRHTHDIVSDIPTLAREFRPFRPRMCLTNDHHQNDMTLTTNTTPHHLEYARRLYQEVVDAVAIVTTNGDTTSLTHPGTSSSSSVPMTPMTMTMSTVKTAADLLRMPNVIGHHPSTTQHHHHPNNNTSIITFCRALDDLLDGGIAVGELTELAGPPGSGKTTLGMQLAVNAALPEYCGGVHGRTVLIDTEGSFSPERCHDLATHLIQHVQTGLKRKHRQSVIHNNNHHHHHPNTTPPPHHHHTNGM